VVSAAIRALTANGTIAKLQQKWFAIDVAKIPVLK
jgi:ABC-type amino acid transport substrate-binding protein